MLSNEDLAALLPRVALGDRAAFERVYRASCAHLLGVAFRILNSRERAEEVLQEAFMNVWHSAGGFDASVAGPMTWLINIVRNKAIDALRSGKTERASSLALDEEALAVAADATQQPQALLERSLEKLRIAGGMGELGAPQRQAPVAMRAVGAWQERLGGLASAVPPMQPSESVWRRLEERLFASARAAPGPMQWLWDVLSVRALGGVLAGAFLCVALLRFQPG